MEYAPGKPFLGGGEEVETGDRVYGAVRALDVLTGERRWEHRLLSPLWAGLMATAGGLVFGSTNEGNVYALDSATGRPSGISRPGAPARPTRSRSCSTAASTSPTACGQALFVFALP